MQTTTERPARVAGELYFPTDISPDQLFEAIGRLRKEARDEIERLLAFLDETDGYSTTEQEINGDEADASFPEGGARLGSAMEDDEPILGSVETHDQRVWASGNRDDCEGDACDDDREGDEQQHGGDEHDGAEPDEDAEPSLGWTEQMAQGQETWGNTDDKEEGGSYITDAARQRYRPFDRYSANCDGRHVDTERGYAVGSRRLTNLSDQQRTAVAPRLNRDGVRI